MSRIEQVVHELRGGQLLRQLRARHDVGVYQFDEQADPTQVAFFNRLGKRSSEVDTTEAAMARKEHDLHVARRTMVIAAGLGGIALVSLLVYLMFGRGVRRRESLSYALLVTMATLVAAFLLFAVANLAHRACP